MEKSMSSDDGLSLAESAASADPSEEHALLVAQAIRSEFSGPLPHPEILAKYEEVFPGAAERIFQMAELQANHRRSMEKDSLHFAARDSLLGILFGFIIAMCGIIAGIAIIICNPSSVIAVVTGSAISGASLIGIIQTFVLGAKRHKENPNTND